LALGLRDAIELAQWIRETAGHGEDAAGFVLQDDHRSLHYRAHTQVGTWPALAVGDTDQDHVVKRELALRACVVDRERQDAAVAQADTPSLAFLAGWLLHHDGGRPVDVIERQSRFRECPLPGRSFVAGFGVRFLLNSLAETCFCGPKLDAPRAALVARETFLQRRLHRPLQLRIDGGAHRIGVRRDRVDSCKRLRFTRHLIDEVEADVAARTFVSHQSGQGRQSTARLLLKECSILPHAAENVGEPFLRPPGMPVGVEIIRPLGQSGKKRAFLERKLLRGLAEIAARSELNAPGAAAEIDGIE
jgi:hypothetical protein